MPPESAGHPADGQSPSAAISNAIVRLLAESTGRGPTQARTTIDRDLVVVLLANALTKGERYLANNSRAEQVLEMRRAYQEAMTTGVLNRSRGHHRPQGDRLHEREPRRS